MYSSTYLALALATFLKSAHATPVAALLPRQSTVPETIKNVDITLCQVWAQQGTCYDISTYAVGSSDTDMHITSNYGVQIDTDVINGISSILVAGDSGVACSFGNLVYSTSPTVICSGNVATLNTGDPELDLGNNNNYGDLNDNVNCFYCSTGDS